MRRNHLHTYAFEATEFAVEATDSTLKILDRKFGEPVIVVFEAVPMADYMGILLLARGAALVA